MSGCDDKCMRTEFGFVGVFICASGRSVRWTPYYKTVTIYIYIDRYLGRCALSAGRVFVAQKYCINAPGLAHYNNSVLSTIASNRFRSHWVGRTLTTKSRPFVLVSMAALTGPTERPPCCHYFRAEMTRRASPIIVHYRSSSE